VVKKKGGHKAHQQPFCCDVAKSLGKKGGRKAHQQIFSVKNHLLKQVA
jgi:hypothetical protein